MKSASAALIAFLDQPDLAFYGADIYTFTLQNGTVFRASTFDRPISYSGAIYPVARAAVNQQYAITGITQASIAVLTIDGHPFTVGDPFQVTGVSGMTQINGLQGYVTFVTPNTIAVIVLRFPLIPRAAWQHFSASRRLADRRFPWVWD